MPRRPRSLFLVLMTAAAALGCRRGESSGGPSGRELRIFVASSLAGAFQDLADTLRARDSTLVVQLNGGGSSSLVSQLELGGSADLLATADDDWMRTAQEKRLARAAIPFAQSSLALVVSTRPGTNEYLREPLNLASPGVKVVLAAPEVPLGRYSRQLLERLAQLPGYGPDFATRVERGVVSQELSAAGVVGKLRLGEADAAIIYRAQLLQDTSGTFRELPVAGAHGIVARYLIALTTRMTDSADAVSFLALVRSPKGRDILKRHGFEIPGEDQPE